MPRRRSAYKLPKLKLKPKTVVTIGTLVSFILAIVSLASIFSTSAKLDFWRGMLEDNFGWTAIFSPIVFVVIGLVIQKTKWKHAQMHTLLGLITAIVALMALSGLPDASTGGRLGELIWTNLSDLITGAGAAAVLLVIFCIGLAVMFQASFSEVMQMLGNGWEKVAKLGGIFHREKGLEIRTAPLRVSGIDNTPPPPPMRQRPVKEDVSSDNVITNVAGQTTVWKYPALGLL